MRMYPVISGVATCGRSRICKALGDARGWSILEADKLHDPIWKENPRPLKVSERELWEQRVSDRFQTRIMHEHQTILDCSALRRSFREKLLSCHDQVVIVVLKISLETALRRVAERRRQGAHWFESDELIRDQFQANERATVFELTTTRTHVVDAERPMECILNDVSRILDSCMQEEIT